MHRPSGRPSTAARRWADALSTGGRAIVEAPVQPGVQGAQPPAHGTFAAANV